jgi:uncharacterized membrane protein
MTTPRPPRPDGFRERGDRVTRLETFVDAAFAFAISMLVISVGTVPDSIAELKDALKNIPAFAASFALIMVFWRGHEDWSRRYGLDDGYSSNLSILLVFAVLVFVYPLRILFGGFFAWITDGWLPTPVAIRGIDELRWFFGSFAVAFGTMGTLMFLLTLHAERHADALDLDGAERLTTRISLLRWLLIPVFAVLSLILTAIVRPGMPNWMIGTPGLIFFLLNFLQLLLKSHGRRMQRNHPERWGSPRE